MIDFKWKVIYNTTIMETLREYINSNLNNLHGVECYVNTENIADIKDKNTKQLLTTGGTSFAKENYSVLHKDFLDSKPIRVYFMDDDLYSIIFFNGEESIHIPEGKKRLVALFSSSILKNKEIIAY